MTLQKVEVVRAADTIRRNLPITLRQAVEAAEELDRLGLLMPDGATEERRMGQYGVYADPSAPRQRRIVTPWEEVTDG